MSHIDGVVNNMDIQTTDFNSSSNDETFEADIPDDCYGRLHAWCTMEIHCMEEDRKLFSLELDFLQQVEEEEELEEKEKEARHRKKTITTIVVIVVVVIIMSSIGVLAYVGAKRM